MSRKAWVVQQQIVLADRAGMIVGKEEITFDEYRITSIIQSLKKTPTQQICVYRVSAVFVGIAIDGVNLKG